MSPRSSSHKSLRDTKEEVEASLGVIREAPNFREDTPSRQFVNNHRRADGEGEIPIPTN